MTRTLRAYFDWHPILGGLTLLAASAIAITALSVFFESFVPAAQGWPICTPLNGAVLAVLLMIRRKLWPFLLLGYILAISLGTALVGTVPYPGASEILGNAAELVIAAFTLPPYRSLKQWLQQARLLRSFTGYALILGPLLKALPVALKVPGSAGAVANVHAAFWLRAEIIGFSEALGIALGTSLVLVLCNRSTYSIFRWRALPGTLGLLALLVTATWFAFTTTTSTVLFLPYALLIVLAFFRGLRGAVLGLATTCAVIIHLAGQEQFLSQTVSPQTCIALAVLTVFPLSVTLTNRSELELRMKEYQAELDRLKSLDRLTGVANRKRFDLVLAREWQRATRDPRPLALLMIDADFFDLYNNHYGTAAGDDCLRRIATKLAEQPHRQYDLVSRFEGGRFSVLLPGAFGDAVKRIAEEFRAEIAALEWPHEPSQFGRVTISVGWASMLPQTDLQPALLISAAEAALSSAKKNGKNRVEGFVGHIPATK